MPSSALRTKAHQSPPDVYWNVRRGFYHGVGILSWRALSWRALCDKMSRTGYDLLRELYSYEYAYWLGWKNYDCLSCFQGG